MDAPLGDPTIRDMTAPPPRPTPLQFGQAVSLVVDEIVAVSRESPHLLNPAAADLLARQLAGLPSLLALVRHAGPTPRLG